MTVNTDPQRVLVRLKQPDTQWALTNSERALHVVDYWAGHCNATVNVSKVVGAMYTPVLRSFLEAHVWLCSFSRGHMVSVSLGFSAFINVVKPRGLQDFLGVAEVKC